MKNYIISLLIVSRFSWIDTGITKMLLIAFCALAVSIMLSWFENEIKTCFRKVRKML